jgi:hypothetical protein
MVVILVGALVASCSSSDSAPVSTDRPQTPVLSGFYRATTPGPISQLGFDGGSRYFLWRSECQGEACFQRGTFSFDPASKVLSLHDGVTRETTTLALRLATHGGLTEAVKPLDVEGAGEPAQLIHTGGTLVCPRQVVGQFDAGASGSGQSFEAGTLKEALQGALASTFYGDGARERSLQGSTNYPPATWPAWLSAIPGLSMEHPPQYYKLGSGPGLIGVPDGASYEKNGEYDTAFYTADGQLVARWTAPLTVQQYEQTGDATWRYGDGFDVSSLFPDDPRVNCSEVPLTAPLDQGDTNDCWAYTTASWVDSIAGVTGAPRVSPVYWVYWRWLDLITGGAPLVDAAFKDETFGGGSWTVAVDLARRYGVMDRGWFVPDDMAASVNAWDVIDASLKTGALSTAAARQDRVLVRRELDRAFGLSPGVSEALDRMFGPDGTRGIDQADTTGVPVRRATEIKVRIPVPGGQAVAGTLADAIGDSKAGVVSLIDEPSRPLAWSSRFIPLDRAGLARIQRALNDGVPVPIDWYVASNGRDDEWRYVSPPATPAVAEKSWWHTSLLVDYEVTNVPGFGTLKAGSGASDDARRAALSDEATVTFFRNKDSLGLDPRQPRYGFDDLYVDYLRGSIRVCHEQPQGSCSDVSAFGGVTLPAGY